MWRRVKVRGTIDGYPYCGSIAPYGGKHYMVVKKEIRGAIGKGGDTVHVVTERDTEERTVGVPADFTRALAQDKSCAASLRDAARRRCAAQDKQAKAFFDKSSYTNRKEYVEWIESAKKPETRARRIQQAVERLAKGMKFS